MRAEGAQRSLCPAALTPACCLCGPLGWPEESGLLRASWCLLPPPSLLLHQLSLLFCIPQTFVESQCVPAWCWARAWSVQTLVEFVSLYSLLLFPHFLCHSPCVSYSSSPYTFLVLHVKGTLLKKNFPCPCFIFFLDPRRGNLELEEFGTA